MAVLQDDDNVIWHVSGFVSNVAREDDVIRRNFFYFFHFHAFLRSMIRFIKLSNLFQRKSFTSFYSDTQITHTRVSERILIYTSYTKVTMEEVASTRRSPCQIVNEEFYARQVYTYGRDAQRKIQESRVLLVGLRGVGVEIGTYSERLILLMTFEYVFFISV